MMLPTTLRWRIQLWHSILLLAVLIGFGMAAHRYQARNILGNLEKDLRSRLNMLHAGMPKPRGGQRPGPGGPPGPDRGPPPREEERPVFNLSADRAAYFPQTTEHPFYYQLWRTHGEVWARSSAAPKDIPMPVRASETSLGANDRERGTMHEVFGFTPNGDVLLVGKSMTEELAEITSLGRTLLLLGGGIFILALAIGWWITRQALRPVQIIAQSARRIAAGHLEERIPVTAPHSELGELSGVLNETFTNLESSFERQARFTADAAHELRTPVAIILSQAQAALLRERDPESYQRTLEACVKAARRLQQLTESLLQLATHDAGTIPLSQREPCDLAELTQEAADLMQPLLADQGMKFSFNLTPASCCADVNRIGQVLVNLLTNALHYNRPQGTIYLTTRLDGSEVLLSVRDEGEGIAPEHMEHIFDRFYRAEASRNRQFGGAGLGLAICQEIASAHGGKLSVTSTPGEGSEFTLRLPA
jgi:two-component system OmpR family sensor kinase